MTREIKKLVGKRGLKDRAMWMVINKTIPLADDHLIKPCNYD